MTTSLDRHRAALEANPDDKRAFEALQESLFLEGRWPELVECYRIHVAAPSLANAPQRRVPLLFRMAQVLEERCLDPDAAVEVYWQVAKLDPTFRPALRQLRRIHETKQQWDMVLQISELEGQLPMEPHERAEFLTSLGDVWHDHLGDLAEARSCYTGALDAQPHDQAALTGLARTLKALGLFAEAAAALERLVQVIRGPERAPAWVSLGKLYDGPLRQSERAAECYRRALIDDASNIAAVEALVIISGAEEQWEGLADLYKQRFDLTAGARHRSAIAIEAGMMHLLRRGDPGAAREWLDRAMALADDDIAVHRAMCELARATDDQETLKRSLARVIDLTPGRAPMSILLEAAGLHSDAGEHEAALRLLELAREQAPNDPLVLECLTDALAHTGRSAELAALLEQKAAVIGDDPEAQTEALTELSRLYEEQLDDPDAAVAALARAFEANPQNHDIARRLERLYTKLERWNELRDLLERVCASGSQEQRCHYACRLGEVLAEQLHDSAGAARAFESALELDPRATAALRGLEVITRQSGDENAMLRLLERQAGATDDPTRLMELVLEIHSLLSLRGRPERSLNWLEKLLEVSPGHVPVLELVAELQHTLGRDAELEVTLGQLDRRLQGPQQARVRLRIAELQRGRGDVEGELTSLEAALESHPADREALERLKSRYTAAHRMQDVVRVQRKLVEVLQGNEQAAGLDELAQLLDEQIGDTEGAIVVLWRLVEMPDRPEHAQDRLESLLERAGRFEELAQQLLVRRRSVPDDGEEAESLDLRRARLLLDPLGQVEEAALLFRAVRTRNPDSAPATEGLEQALRAGNDSAGLALLLESKARATVDPRARVGIEFERALILEEALGELEASRSAFEALARQRSDAAVAEQAEARLERLLERTGQWEALRAHLEATLASVDPAEEYALRARLASLCRDRVGDPAGSIEHLEAMGRLRPERGETWRDLALLYEEDGDGVALLRVIEAELAQGPLVDRERTLRSRAAQVCLELARGDRQSASEREALLKRAQSHYEGVVAADAGHADACEFLMERYEEAGRDADVARLLRGRLDATTSRTGSDVGQRMSLQLRLASLLAERLDDLPEATRILEDACRESRSDPAVATPLAELYERTGDHAQLAQLCRHVIERCSEAGDRAGWCVRLAEALRQNGDPVGATEAYCTALESRPGDGRIERVLCELYREIDEPAPLAALLEAELGRAGGAAPATLRIELAELLAERLGRPEEALAHLRSVLEASPTAHSDAFPPAIALAERLGQHEDILALLDTRLTREPAGDTRAELLERRGTLLSGELARLDEAAGAFREAIALAPGRTSAHRGLRSVFERLERWSAVLDCMHLEAEASRGAERVAILERAIELAEARVSSDASLPWLERLRLERPEDPGIPRRMAAVHRHAGRPEALLRALESELEIVGEGARRFEIHMERARVFERDLRAPGRAIAAYETARELRPEDDRVLEELDRLYDLMGRTSERVEVLEAQIERSEPARRVALHRTAATLCATALTQPEQSIPHLLHAVALARDGAFDGSDAAHLELLRELAETLRAAGHVDAWARAAEAELELLDPAAGGAPARTAELHYELAECYGRRLGAPTRALRHLLALLGEEGAPHSTCLGERFLSPSQHARAESDLIDRLRADRNHTALARRLAARLDAGRGESNDWLELARIRAEVLHSPSAAAEAFRQVLAVQPDSLAAIRGLRHTTECLGDWPEVARSLELELALENRWSPQELLVLQRRLGDVCWHRLRAHERAIQAYEAALAALPGDLSALRSLAQLLEVCERWPELAQCCQREIELLGSDEPARRNELWLLLAHIADRHLDDPQRAQSALEEAERIEPLAAADQHRLAELYRSSNDMERYAESFALWCDHPDASASGWDRLALVAALRELGRPDAALARALEATEMAPDKPEIWDALAELREQAGDPVAASEALERAAALHPPTAGAARLVRAALFVEDAKPERALTLLRGAVERDPGLAQAQAARARVAEAQGDLEEAEIAAERALDIPCAEYGLSGEERLEVALIGGRCARRRERLAAAAIFFDAALQQDPDHVGALDAQGDILFEQGEFSAARSVLERRVSHAGPNPQRARQLAIVARGLEQDGDTSAALARYNEALALRMDLDLAHGGIVRLHEEAGHGDLAVRALERWIESDASRSSRGASHLRAARHLLNDGRTEDAEAHLRDALRDAPELEEGWILLTELLFELEREDEALEVGEAAMQRIDAPDRAAGIALVVARVLDRRGETRRAAESYALAARGEPHCCEAALAESRLLRGAGDWYAAAGALERFVASHPDPDDAALSVIHLERGRLMAGPLENVEEAVRCYERAIELEPGMRQAREPLAALLAHVPERWKDAVAHHRDLLAEDPTRQGSLRALLEISRRRDIEGACDLGLTILRALGAASPEEGSLAPSALTLRLKPGPALANPVFEAARQICQAASQEIGEMLRDWEFPPAEELEEGDAGYEYWRRIHDCEDALTAPGVGRLSEEEMGSLVYTVTALAADPGGNCNDGPFLHDLDQTLGRRTKRRIRKLLGETSVRTIQSIDYAAWHAELRSLASAMALDESGGDLRSALVALCRTGRTEPGPSADISALIGGSEPASGLLARVVSRWCDEICARN